MSFPQIIARYQTGPAALSTVVVVNQRATNLYEVAMLESVDGVEAPAGRPRLFTEYARTFTYALDLVRKVAL